jgi:GNAT superfamily N-acetyltransferase
VTIVTRPAVPDDAAALARIHVLAWQVAYRGHMPDAFLDGIDLDARVAWWEEQLAGDHPADTRLLVVEHDGQPAGFALVRAAEDPPGLGELQAINTDPGLWGLGLGRALLAAAEAALAELGYDEAILWVVAGNTRARRFYELAGWAADGATWAVPIADFTVESVRYRRRLPRHAAGLRAPRAPDGEHRPALGPRPA